MTVLLLLSLPVFTGGHFFPVGALAFTGPLLLLLLPLLALGGRKASDGALPPGEWAKHEAGTSGQLEACIYHACTCVD